LSRLSHFNAFVILISTFYILALDHSLSSGDLINMHAGSPNKQNTADLALLTWRKTATGCRRHRDNTSDNRTDHCNLHFRKTL